MMDAEIDRLIEEELSKLGISEDDLENYAEEDLPLSGDDSDIEADIPESVLTYFEAARDRVSVFERDIHDNQESDGDAAVWRTTPIPCCHSDPLLMELAASAGDEDPAALKQRIMCELEEQLCFTTEHTHSEAAQDPNGTAQEDRGTAQVDSTVVAGGPCEQEPEQRSPHDNLEELERRSPHHDLEKLERRLREEDEELEELERRLREEDEKLDRRLVEEEMRRRRQQEAQRQQHLLTQQEEQESRRRRQQQAEEELRRIEEEHTQRPPEDEEQQREEQMEKREQELARQQEVIRRLAVEVEEERRAFEEARREQRRRKQQQQHQAATTIQAAVKGLITRRWSRPAIKQRREEDRRREEEKRRREEERRQREEERREREDRLRRAQEEEKKRREEEEAQLREEQEKRRRGEREEQERRRKAYEKAKQEERQRLEQERKEEEERRRAEEERRRKDAEEERRRKEAEEKKRWGEEEVKRREEEERRRKEAEEKKRREEEENRRRKEAEKKRQEEEEGVNRQEKDKEEQVKREEEEERKSREDEEQQRRQEEERTRPEEEERQREEERKREVEKEEKRRELEKEERKREEQERKRELNEDIKSIQTENKQEQKVKRVADAERDPIYVRREAHQQTGDGQDPSGTPATLEDKNTHQKDIALGDTDIHQKDSTLGDTDTQQKDIALGDTDTQQKDIALGDTDTQQEAATSPDHLPCDQTQPMTTQPVHTAPAENHTVGQKTPAQQLPHGELLSHRCAGPKYDVYSGVSAAAAAVTVGVSAGSLCLPDAVEQKRLSWMRSCLPWSKMAALCRRKRPPEQGSSRRGRRGARRTQQPSLQPLALDTLLQAGPWNTLSQVTSVSLSDLPGCSLSSLAACPQLRSLTLHRCGINALEGLNTCTHLTHIDLQDNCVSSVDCSGLCGLQVLRLGGNQLTSIHGLQDATQLLHLHLSHNRISRLGGLEGLKRLQVLCVDHNLLTSVRGLDEAFTLQELDLSHNHLTHAHGLEQCALLRTLRLDGNTLTEAPRLGNHVLLGELSLQDNSISSLELLTSSWLPLLHTLHLANNSLTRLPLLSDLISLSYLDLRHNCLSELRSVCESVGQCCYLLELWLDGNPLQQDCNWRSSVVACVPGLLLLDGEQTGEPPAPNATQPSKAPNATQSTAGHPHAMTNTSHHPYTPHAPLGSFRALCKAQLQQLSCLQHTHTAQTSSASSPLEAQLLIGRHGDALFQLAEEQRYAHEYGDTSVTHTQTTHTPSLERAHTPSLDTAPQPVASCTIVHPAQGPLETSCPAPGSMEAHKRPLEVPHLHAAFSMEAHKPPLGVPHSHPAFSMEAHKPPLEVPYSHPAHASMEAAYPAVSSRCPLHAGEVMPASKQQSGHLPSPPHPELRTHRGPHRTDNMELRKRGEESRHTGSMELGRDVDSQHPELDLGDKGSRYTEGWRDGGTHQLNGKDGGQRHTELDLESVAVMDIQKNCLGQQGHTRKCQPGSGHPVADGKCSPAAEAESWGTLPTPLSRQRAATIIQAVWRGHVLRSRLAVALAASSHTHLEDEEEEDEEEDEGLMEVDVDAFDFNEDAVESGWMALRSVGASPCQQWPEVTMPVCVSDRPPLPKVVPPAAVHHSRRPVLLWQPKQAWCGSQETLHPETCIPQRCKSPASAASWDSISARSEKILEEWGFKDSRTAYMMLKRAQRMKTRKQQQGRTRGRAEAGGGSEEEVAQGRRRERRRSSGRSKGYQWIHTQPVTLATPPAPALASPHTCYSERFLPLMSPDVMNGGRVQLVAMTGHRDVEAAGAGREQHHSGSEVPAPQDPREPRERGGSAQRGGSARGSAQQRGGSAPCRRERLSFRDQPVQRSVGWGGGKKRTTRPQN